MVTTLLIHEFVVVEEVALLQTLVLCQKSHALEEIKQIILFVLEEVPVLHTIDVHAFLDIQVISVLFQSATKIVTDEEIALLLIHALVSQDMLENNVKHLYVLENLPTQLLHVEMEAVKIITLVYAILDTMDINAKHTTAMESIVTLLEFVVAMEYVQHQTYVHVIQVTMDRHAFRITVMDYQLLIHQYVLIRVVVQALIDVRAIVDTLEKYVTSFHAMA
jgi:hypothetical protein